MEEKMNVVLLSGGSGKRLWPLSNDIRSKQFIKIFKHGNIYESMVQRVYRQIKTVDPDATITVATSKSQVSALQNQIGKEVGISIEPCRKDTFPAIALACAYLHDIQKIDEEEAVVICPVDPYVGDEYFDCLHRMCNVAKEGKSNIVLMGIKPTYPSEKYGYILPENDVDRCSSYSFTEKPTTEKAIGYIQKGALWNGGAFSFRLKYILGKCRELLGTSKYDEIYNQYAELKKISFDYAVVEKEKSLEVIRYDGTWKDLGTWNTLTEAMEEETVGNVRISETCSNVHVLNELDVPIIVMGMKDAVISASPEGILVSDKEQSSFIKPYVDEIDQQVMYAEKSWGSFRVLDVEKESLTIKVSLNSGHKMKYHSHDYRDEIWMVISGSGKTIIEGIEQKIQAGDVVSMKAGEKHTVIAGDAGLQMIEVQIGKEICVADKHIFSL